MDRKFLVLFVMTNLVANIMVNLLVKVVRAFSKDRFDETLLINVGATKAAQLTSTIETNVSIVG